MASYNLKLFIRNCGQTAADENMVTSYSQPIESRQRPIRCTIADPLRFTVYPQYRAISIL